MNREIKFRAWKIVEDINKAVFVYGSLIESSHPSCSPVIAYWKGSPIAKLEMIEVFHDTVGQYTGLKDKNGVEIWENDLVELDNNRLCKVVWHSYSGRWDLKFISEKQLTPKFLPCGINDIRNRGEVIGNIHENPELLN